MSRPAESLLPGTDALPCGTLEMGEYRSGWLVRLRSLDGGVKRQKFTHGQTDQAFALFLHGGKSCDEKPAI